MMTVVVLGPPDAALPPDSGERVHEVLGTCTG